MKNHLVYIHNGIIPEYLYDTMEIARSYNKFLPITLITDAKDCLDKLKLINVNYEYIDFFNSVEYKNFLSIYINKTVYDKHEPGYKYEIFNFFRFVILYNFTKKYNIENIVYCDSDLAILHNLEDDGCYLNLIKNNDLILLWSYSTFYSCWNFKTLELFNIYMYNLFKNIDNLNIAANNFNEIVRNKKHFSDMWLLSSFIYTNNIIVNDKTHYDETKKINLQNNNINNFNVFFCGNFYKDWAKGILNKDNKYSDTFRTLVNTYNDKFLLNFNDNTINNLCYDNKNINMIKEINFIKKCIKIDKQKIIHFQGQSKNLVIYFKNTIIDNIVNFQNSKCSFGNITINNLIGFVPEDNNLYINKDIQFENYNIIFAHANCSIELNIIKSIKINAFIINNVRSIFNTLNNNIKFIIDNNLIDNINPSNYITKEFILEEGIHTIQLVADNGNAYCHTGFYWNYN